MRRELLGLACGWLVGCVPAALAAEAEPPASRISVIYSTDLLHPHDDPDDHYDLATLFSLAELDVRGVVLDLGERQRQRMGRAPVEQILQIAGRRVPFAIGIDRPLRTGDDQADDAPPECQGGIELILSILRQAQEKVVIFTTGSLRDVAAAYNREPELLRDQVRALYFNAGNGPGGPQKEWNVTLDPTAYLRVFESGLPLFWCPCYGEQGYQTHFIADQAAVVGACAPAVQNFFVYCLSKSQEDPLAFLRSGEHPLPKGPRNMWCTGPLYHAAGRRIYERDEDDFAALQPAQARQAGLADKEVTAFRFSPVRVTVGKPKRPEPAKLAEPAPGQLTAAFLGRDADRVGTRDVSPDGKPDCHVRLLGLDADKPVQNVVLTGPKEGRWEQIETGRWWRVACERQGRQLDVCFQFWAAGEHRAEIVYQDKSTQAATFVIPEQTPAELRTEFDAQQPNCFLFQQTEPRFGRILASCLKNTLAELGRH